MMNRNSNNSDNIVQTQFNMFLLNRSLVDLLNDDVDIQNQ